AGDGIRYFHVTGIQPCALPSSSQLLGVLKVTVPPAMLTSAACTPQLSNVPAQPIMTRMVLRRRFMQIPSRWGPERIDVWAGPARSEERGVGKAAPGTARPRRRR